MACPLYFPCNGNGFWFCSVKVVYFHKISGKQALGNCKTGVVAENKLWQKGQTSNWNIFVDLSTSVYSVLTRFCGWTAKPTDSGKTMAERHRISGATVRGRKLFCPWTPLPILLFLSVQFWARLSFVTTNLWDLCFISHKHFQEVLLLLQCNCPDFLFVFVAWNWCIQHHNEKIPARHPPLLPETHWTKNDKLPDCNNALHHKKCEATCTSLWWKNSFNERCMGGISVRISTLLPGQLFCARRIGLYDCLTSIRE